MQSRKYYVAVQRATLWRFWFSSLIGFEHIFFFLFFFCPINANQSTMKCNLQSDWHDVRPMFVVQFLNATKYYPLPNHRIQVYRVPNFHLKANLFYLSSTQLNSTDWHYAHELALSRLEYPVNWPFNWKSGVLQLCWAIQKKKKE